MFEENMSQQNPAAFQIYTKNEGKYIFEQIHTMEQQLEDLRIKTINLNDKLASSYNSEQFNITKKYLELLKNHHTVCRKIKKLEAESNKIKIVSKTGLEDFTVKCRNSCELLEEKQKLYQTELQQQIEKDSSEYNERVQKLNNELDLVQATTSLQRDELETEICKELVDINVKIGQMQKINARVQTDIDDLKCLQKRMQERQNIVHVTRREDFKKNYQNNGETSQQRQTDSYKVIAENANKNRDEAKKKIKDFYIQNDKHNVQNLKTTNLTEKIKRFQKPTNQNIHYKKYQPLSISTTCSHGTSELPQGEIRKDSSGICSNNGTKPKKRKLFNPDDLDYLIKLEIPTDGED